MAGGKETPRQKMIGMMYLVLTALLALQVSNSVLDRFDFIDVALKRQNNEKTESNVRSVSAIQSAVEEKGNRKDDVAALDRAKEVRQLTAELMSYMESLRTDMETITGGRDEATGQLIGKQDYDKVSTMMVQQGKGKEMQAKLNEYSTKLSQIAKDDFKPLAVDAKEIPGVQNDPDQKNKLFAEYFFENTPTGAGLATLSYLESEVLAYETKALEDIKEMVGAKDIAFGAYFPVILPESNIVAAGTKFKGQLFISAATTGTDPEMEYNLAPSYPDDKKVSVEVAEGKGLVEFTASPGNYNKDGLAEKKFNTYITLNDTTLVYEHTYFVAKPTIQIQSAALQALYYRCGNELDIQVPVLGAAYNPSYRIKGGTHVVGNKKGLVTVIPTGKSVDITVSSNGNTIGTEKFRVRPVPKPHIELAQGSKKINFKTGVKATALRALNIRAVGDEDFAAQLPKDARYRVVEWTITLARGSRPIGAPMTLKGGNQTANLSQFASSAKPGDRYVIEVKRVARRNFQDQTEPVTGIPNTIFTIPLN